MENNNAEHNQGMELIGLLQDINGLWFNQKNFSLDGYRFIGCRFDSCTLHVSTLSFELINCHIDTQTNIIYGGQTLKIVKLYNSRNEYAYQHMTVFAPDKNPDGTISIKGY